MNTTTSFTSDAETRRKLEILCKQDNRPMSNLIQTLVNQEYARRFSQPQPLITVEDAETAERAQLKADYLGGNL